MDENGVVRFGLGMVVDVNGVPMKIEQVRRTKLVMTPVPAFRQAGNVVMEVDRDAAEAAMERGIEWYLGKLNGLQQKLDEISEFVEEGLEEEAAERDALERVAGVLDFNLGVEVE